MKRLFTACAVLVVLLLTNLSAKTGTADKTAEAQIKSAMSAAPPSISAQATKGHQWLDLFARPT